jgi:hypothetical protein
MPTVSDGGGTCVDATDGKAYLDVRGGDVGHSMGDPSMAAVAGMFILRGRIF